MMSVAERVAMRGRAEEDDGVKDDAEADAGVDLDDVTVLKRRREGEDAEDWDFGEKAATQPMILE